MEIFAYNPSHRRESIGEFNARIQEFCAETPVTAINSAVIGGTIIICVSVGNDSMPAGVPTLTAQVAKIDDSDKEIEDYLNDRVAHEESLHTDSDPRVPIETRIYQRNDDDKLGWMVIISINGELEDGDHDEPENITTTEEEP